MVRAEPIQGIDQAAFLDLILVPARLARWTSFRAKAVLRRTSFAHSLVDADDRLPVPVLEKSGSGLKR